ncbi:TPA: hypothetical protein ACGD77_002973 [Serratia marcescens]
MEKPSIAQFMYFCASNKDLQLDFRPHDCGSWRGVYADPCIFVENGTSTLSEFIPYLERLVNDGPFYGYKGGEYSYNKDSDLNMEMTYGSYSGDESMIYEVLSTIRLINAAFLKVTIEAA